jgi:hypothetical protein
MLVSMCCEGQVSGVHSRNAVAPLRCFLINNALKLGENLLYLMTRFFLPLKGDSPVKIFYNTLCTWKGGRFIAKIQVY